MDIVALEEIKRVKHRYLRCVDLKSWDELTEVFADDATADYGTPIMGDALKFTGRDAIVEFLRTSLGPGLITVHLASQPEIDIDGDTATGRWSFKDTVIATEHRVVIEGAAFYEDRFTRDSGAWRIQHIGYVRNYELTYSLDDLPSLKITANRWADD